MHLSCGFSQMCCLLSFLASPYIFDADIRSMPPQHLILVDRTMVHQISSALAVMLSSGMATEYDLYQPAMRPMSFTMGDANMAEFSYHRLLPIRSPWRRWPDLMAMQGPIDS